MKSSLFDQIYCFSSLVQEDIRGSFFKYFSRSNTSSNSHIIPSSFEVKEAFTSFTRNGSIRGMHFQLPPFSTHKVVTVLSGQALDVCLDLSKTSSTYGCYKSFLLNRGDSLFIPVGFAHGFQSLTDNMIMSYLCSEAYSPMHDSGLLWNSFGFTWPLACTSMSQRDLSFKPFDKHTPLFP